MRKNNPLIRITAAAAGGEVPALVVLTPAAIDGNWCVPLE